MGQPHIPRKAKRGMSGASGRVEVVVVRLTSAYAARTAQPSRRPAI